MKVISALQSLRLLSAMPALLITMTALNATATTAEIMNEIRKTHQLPALGIAIVDGVSTEQFISGVRKHGDPTLAKIADKFHLGSNTKAMTATVAAILVDRGLMRWDQTLAESFPQFTSKMNAAFKNVTVAMLSSHMSGLTGAIDLFDKRVLWKTLWNPALDPVEGRKIVASSMLTAPPASKPGSKNEYSNANYIILAAIMEAATGKSWETLMREELFSPLGMWSCGFGSQASPKFSIPDHPWPHTPAATGPAFVIPDFYSDNPPTVGPAGTVHCTMEDWAKFARLHLDAYNGRLRKNFQVSGRAFAKLYETPPGQVYTYGGWIKVSQRWSGGVALTHAGSNGLNMSTMWIAPLKSRAYIIVTNIGGDEGAGTAMNETAFKLINGTFKSDP